jgi:hypothetical protein
MNNPKIKKIDPSQIRYAPEDGEVIQTPEGDYLIWKDGNWNKVNYEGSDINLALYDMNKQIISQLPNLENIEDKHSVINSLHKKFQNEFYMLYGKEISYFTLFQIKNNEIAFGREVIDCLNNVGQIKAIDMTEPEDAIEIWVYLEEDEDVTCLYLFPYDAGLVRVGE